MDFSPCPEDYLIIIEESKLAATLHQGTVGHILLRKHILSGIDVRHMERAAVHWCHCADVSCHAVGDSAAAVAAQGSRDRAI